MLVLEIEDHIREIKLIIYNYKIDTLGYYQVNYYKERK